MIHRLCILLVFLLLATMGTAQTLEKSQAIMIYNIVPTTAPCTFCSERAFVRADNNEYRWNGSAWIKWANGTAFSSALLQDSIIVNYSFGVEVGRDTVRVAAGGAGTLTSIGAGTNTTVDNTDPANPIINVPTLNDADASPTNEGALTVGAGGANDANIVSNTSGGAPIKLQGAGNTTITEDTGTGVITISSTGGGSGITGSLTTNTIPIASGSSTLTNSRITQPSAARTIITHNTVSPLFSTTFDMVGAAATVLNQRCGDLGNFTIATQVSGPGVINDFASNFNSVGGYNSANATGNLRFKSNTDALSLVALRVRAAGAGVNDFTDVFNVSANGKIGFGVGGTNPRYGLQVYGTDGIGIGGGSTGTRPVGEFGLIRGNTGGWFDTHFGTSFGRLYPATDVAPTNGQIPVFDSATGMNVYTTPTYGNGVYGGSGTVPSFTTAADALGASVGWNDGNLALGGDLFFDDVTTGTPTRLLGVTATNKVVEYTRKDTLVIAIYCQGWNDAIATGADYRGWRVPSQLNNARIIKIQYSADDINGGTVLVQTTNGVTNFGSATIPVGGDIESGTISQTITTGQRIRPDVNSITGSPNGLMMNLIIEK